MPRRAAVDVRGHEPELTRAVCHTAPTRLRLEAGVRHTTRAQQRRASVARSVVGAGRSSESWQCARKEKTKRHLTTNCHPPHENVIAALGLTRSQELADATVRSVEFGKYRIPNSMHVDDQSSALGMGQEGVLLPRQVDRAFRSSTYPSAGGRPCPCMCEELARVGKSCRRPVAGAAPFGGGPSVGTDT